MNKDMTDRLITYAKSQPNKEQNLQPFNPDSYQWEQSGTKWKQLLVILLSPLSCVLVWIWLAFLSSSK